MNIFYFNDWEEDLWFHCIILNKCMFNMHLNTFKKIQIHETCASSVWKYDESTIEIGYFILSNG